MRLFLVSAVGLFPLCALAQTTPPAAAAAVEKTLEQTASPELVGQLTSQLGVTPSQAEGAAGAMFGLAKTKLSADEFAKVAGAVPNMDGLLKAAPAPDAKASALGALAGATGGISGIAGLAGSFSKLGLTPETVVKLVPTLTKAVEAKGGAEVAGLLGRALK